MGRKGGKEGGVKRRGYHTGSLCSGICLCRASGQRIRGGSLHLPGGSPELGKH